MSVMVNLSPQMETDVREYVTQDSEELARLFISYLSKELEQRRKARQNPLSKYVGCIADGRRTDDVVNEMRGYDKW